MNKKRVFGFLALWVLVFVILSNLVSAYAYYGGYFGNVIDSVVNAWEPILAALLGGFGWSGMYLFERLLLFIMLVSIVFVVTSRIPLFEEQRAVRWVIAIVIPLIGIRYIDYQWLSSILFQYQFLAIFLSAVLPFIIIFYFIHSIVGEYYPFLRKVLWVAFVIIYLGLWASADSSSNSAMYFWTFVAGLICLFADNLIERQMRYRQQEKADRRFRTLEAGNINHEIIKIQEQMKSGALDEKVGRQAIKDLEKHRKWILR